MRLLRNKTGLNGPSIVGRTRMQTSTIAIKLPLFSPFTHHWDPLNEGRKKRHAIKIMTLPHSAKCFGKYDRKDKNSWQGLTLHFLGLHEGERLWFTATKMLDSCFNLFLYGYFGGSQADEQRSCWTTVQSYGPTLTTSRVRLFGLNKYQRRNTSGWHTTFQLGDSLF